MPMLPTQREEIFATCLAAGMAVGRAAAAAGVDDPFEHPTFHLSAAIAARAEEVRRRLAGRRPAPARAAEADGPAIGERLPHPAA